MNVPLTFMLSQFSYLVFVVQLSLKILKKTRLNCALNELLKKRSGYQSIFGNL